MRGWPTHDLHVHPELYRAILERILSGEFAPGQRLVEEELARTQKVSRTPVREVLFALERDGLIQRERNKGARVAAFTADDVEELFDLRKALEVSCVPNATRTMKLNELLDLDRRLEALSSLKGAALHAEQSEIDLQLHRFIVQHSGNRRLIAHMGTLSLLINSLQLASYRLEDRADEAVVEHRGVVRALLQRDVALAQRLLAEHIDSGKRNAVEMLLGFGSKARTKESAGPASRKSKTAVYK